MKFEQSGIDNREKIIMVSGMFFGNAFKHTAALALQYHLIMPNLPGYGEDTGRNFDVDTAYNELKEMCIEYGQYEPVHIVGFCTGAELVYKLICEMPQLFRSAVLISPVLYNKENYVKEMIPYYLQDLKKMKKTFVAKFIAKYNAMPKSELNTFAEQMKKVTEETVRNSVDNGISFSTVKGLENFSRPLLVLAGKKEKAEVIETAKKMTQFNDHCEVEILKDAAHNIPTVFGDGLLHRLERFYVEDRDPKVRRMSAEAKWEE